MSEEVEERALIRACELAMDMGYEDFQVEGDAINSISFISGNVNKKEIGCFWTFRNRAKDKGLVFEHTLREGNYVAHFLAELGEAQLILFNRVDQLPIRAKQSYYADLFGWAHFRV
ncbi:unnamed protein product [Cuscuta epithymum]|uniref:RNase H type-1 domain-containing protein n=1 Tax=Cuscuta epithymum TaxID=186058 RepID=A0AAV0CZM5_9ASTE|nr:unnamed protein product [Cuscuta epithymum]